MASLPPAPTRLVNISFQSLLHSKSNMAESEEEVDVEDISDGEQISNLRDLAEDNHKDKWYDNVSGFISNLKLCLGDIRLDIYAIYRQAKLKF